MSDLACGGVHDAAATGLPVMHSVLAPEGIACLVERHYGCGPVVDCTLLRSYVNEVYALQVASGGRFIFKLSRREWRGVADAAWEVEIQRHLLASGCAVSEPVAQRRGAFVVRVHAPEGERAGVLYAELDGEKPSPPFADGLYERHGVALATLHTALDSVPTRPAARAYDAATLIDRPLAAISRACGGSSTTAERIATHLRARLGECDPMADWGICHGDPTMDNVHVLPGGRHAFFDFDLAGSCWRALDLSGIYEWSRREPDARSFWSAFLAGYRSTRPFGDADVALLPVMAAAWELWDIGHEIECWTRWSGTWRMTPTSLLARIDRLAALDMDVR